MRYAERTIAVLFAAGVVAWSIHAIVLAAPTPNYGDDKPSAASELFRSPSLSRGLAALAKEFGMVGTATFIGRRILRLRL